MNQETIRAAKLGIKSYESWKAKGIDADGHLFINRHPMADARYETYCAILKISGAKINPNEDLSPRETFRQGPLRRT